MEVKVTVPVEESKLPTLAIFAAGPTIRAYWSVVILGSPVVLAIETIFSVSIEVIL